ncbi:MAG: transaldolase [Chloroflexi bacterium]|nr:transaldolase [Chloroflexota bacterium]MBL07360.1 transaldolase [Chloroflexota bacterium]|tara:strand:- start:3326 stop:4366 length:1041 start_codon:yes stop_codon:yes gene_type:complete
MTNINKLSNKGQSIWLDSLSKQMIETGDLKNLINKGITGVTSNPSIFEKAIGSSDSYDKKIVELSKNNNNSKDIFENIATDDIRNAADLLDEVFEKNNHMDGFVSLEVDPFLANDFEKTIIEAKRLWEKVDRKNLMIKIPGTKEGIMATKQLLEEGINVNVTLLFSFDSYKKTLEAFVESKNKNVNSKSVASFFISRIDTAVDQIIDNNNKLFHKMAIINAYKAYSLFLEIKNSMGDNFQKLLWASTSVKAKDLEQDYYSINLPFENTVNTLPLETIDYLLKSDLNFTSESNLSKNFNKLYRESKDYFDFQKVTESLLKNGINLFQDSYKSVLDTIDQKVSKLIKK